MALGPNPRRRRKKKEKKQKRATKKKHQKPDTSSEFLLCCHLQLSDLSSQRSRIIQPALNLQMNGRWFEKKKKKRKKEKKGGTKKKRFRSTPKVIPIAERIWDMI
jgi:hypothetical protein